VQWSITPPEVVHEGLFESQSEPSLLAWSRCSVHLLAWDAPYHRTYKYRICTLISMQEFPNVVLAEWHLLTLSLGLVELWRHCIEAKKQTPKREVTPHWKLVWVNLLSKFYDLSTIYTY
jgi:hypothetical protein